MTPLTPDEKWVVRLRLNGGDPEGWNTRHVTQDDDARTRHLHRVYLRMVTLYRRKAMRAREAQDALARERHLRPESV